MRTATKLLTMLIALTAIACGASTDEVDLDGDQMVVEQKNSEKTSSLEASERDLQFVYVYTTLEEMDCGEGGKQTCTIYHWCAWGAPTCQISGGSCGKCR